MTSENAVWKGLFEWSMSQGDGTSAPRPMSEEDRAWLEGALKSAMIDLSKRMQDIKVTLDGGDSGGGGGGGDVTAAEPATLQQKEQLLDELQDIVESIDLARDLGTIGGLQTLLDLLGSPHPSLRWRAAEVAATCVQNNPPVQKAFMDGGLLPRLLPLLHDTHAVVATKALLALSCCVRGYPPALLWWRQQGGLAELVRLAAEQGGEPRLQRKCLQVLQYMLRVVPLDRRPACDAGLLPALSAAFDSEDGGVREAALAAAAQLAADDACLHLMQRDAGFGAALQALQVRLDSLPKEDWPAAEEEAAGAAALAEAMQRDVPEPGDAPPAAEGAAAAVVDDSSMSGAPPTALQLVAVPAAEPQQQQGS